MRSELVSIHSIKTIADLRAFVGPLDPKITDELQADAHGFLTKARQNPVPFEP